MFFKRIIGTVTLTISTAEPVKLLNAILKKRITVLSAGSDSYYLKVKVFFTDYFKLKRLAKSRDESIEEIKSESGVISVFYRYRLRYGIAVGFLLIVMLSIYLSNTLLEIRIYGATDEAKAQILNVLKSNGVTIGSFLPAVDRFSLECDIVDNSSIVSLADTRTEGSVLCIDVKMTDEKPEIEKSRLSADIVAERDAVITKLEVYSGQAIRGVGEEVKKGDKIVSGEMTLRGKRLPIEEKAYAYSTGHIYADYDETVSFFVPFKDSEMTVEKNVFSKTYFQFFSAQIPLNPLSSGDGLKENEEISYFSLFGIKLPVGITQKTYDEYSYTPVKRSESEAKKLAYKKIEKYEKNLLSDKKILSKAESVTKSKSGITVKVSYRLNGEIGKTQEILKK